MAQSTVQKIQTILAVEPDGIWGPKSQKALIDQIGKTGGKEIPPWQGKTSRARPPGGRNPIHDAASRLSGVAISICGCRHDILVATDVANRHHQEIQGLIGLLLNQVVVRTRLDGRSTFRALLHLIREGTLDAYANQDLPFKLLVKELHPMRSLQYAPLVQVKLVLENTPMLVPSGFTRGSIVATPRAPASEAEEEEHVAAQIDLIVLLSHSAAGIGGSVLYSRDLFEPDRIARLMDDYVAVLREFSSSLNARFERKDAPYPHLT